MPRKYRHHIGLDHGGPSYSSSSACTFSSSPAVWVTFAPVQDRCYISFLAFRDTWEDREY